MRDSTALFIKSENEGLILANELDMFPFNTIMKEEVYELYLS